MLTVSPLVRLQRAPDGGFIVAAGQGSGRVQLDVSGTALASWIIGFSGPMSDTDLRASLSELTGDVASAADLLATLVDSGVLVDEQDAKPLAAKGARWEGHGWRDAFDFHYSGAGLKFFGSPDIEVYHASVRTFMRDSDELGLPPQPGPYKEPVGGASVALRDCLVGYPQSVDTSLAAVLAHRRTTDRFPTGRVRIAELAHLLKHAFGVQRAMPTVWGEALLKTYPSGGARHPLELYVAVREVAGLEPGIYRYDLRCDELRTVRAGSALSELDAAAHHQAGIATAGAVLLVTCRWLRNTWKYRYSRNYRMILIEVGHAARTVAMVAFALGLDAHCTTGIDEGPVSDLLGLPNDLVEGPMYAIGIGRDEDGGTDG